MSRGPNGEKRLADVIGNPVHVMRTATGEIDEQTNERSPAATLGRCGGLKRGQCPRSENDPSAAAHRLAAKVAHSRDLRNVHLVDVVELAICS